MSEPIDPEWGICDHGPLPDALLYGDDEDYDDEGWEEPGEEDEGSPLEILARFAVDIEAGLDELPPGWKLDRPRPGVLVWTFPSGQRCASTLDGEWLPLPGVGTGQEEQCPPPFSRSS